MSLIYEALKKLETTRYDYERRFEIRPFHAGRRTDGLKAPLLLGLVFISAFVASAFVYFYVLSYAGARSGARSTVDAAVPFQAPAPVIEKAQTVTAGELNRSGIALFRAGAYEKALEKFTEALEKEPSSSVIANNMGLTYFKLGRFKESERYLKKALDLSPAYPEALNNYGVLLQRLGKDDRAVDLFEKAVMLDGSYPDPHLNMAISLERLERYSEALIHYRRFFALKNGDYEPVKRRIQALRSALLSEAGD